jgi:hypothetical protein
MLDGLVSGILRDVSRPRVQRSEARISGGNVILAFACALRTLVCSFSALGVVFPPLSISISLFVLALLIWLEGGHLFI